MLRIKHDGIGRFSIGVEQGSPGQRLAPRSSGAAKLDGRARVKGQRRRTPRHDRAPVAVQGDADFGRCLEYAIAVRPLVKERHRAGSGQHYTPEQTRHFEARVADEARLAVRAAEMFVSPVLLTLGFMFSGDAELWPVASDDGDLSNLVKAVEDGMNKIVYPDDRSIVGLHAVKLAGPIDCIWVKVEAAREDDLAMLIREKIRVLTG